MYGLGKINFLIKRYELAVHWFTKALRIKRDGVYHAWLGYTYIKLSEKAEDTRIDYLNKAVDHCTEGAKDDCLFTVSTFALLILAVDLHKHVEATGEVIGLKQPGDYLEHLESSLDPDSVELTLAKAYVDLSSDDHISEGVAALNSCIEKDPSRPEPYLMLAKHQVREESVKIIH